METAGVIVALAQGWLWIGGLCAVALLATLGRFEPAARGAWAFRPLLIPGLMLLWPLVLWRIARGPGHWTGRHAPPFAAQGALALGMVVAVVGALALGWAIRQGAPAATAAVQIEPPR